MENKHFNGYFNSMSYTEIITLVIGILVTGVLTGIYAYYRIRKNSIANFIINGSKDIKRLHYILKSSEFKIIDVNKNCKYKIWIDNKIEKHSFKVVAIAKKKKRRYACFIRDPLMEELDYEMLFKAKMSNCSRGLIIDPELFDLQEFKIMK